MPYAFEHIPDFFDLTSWEADVSSRPVIGRLAPLA